MRLYFLRHGEAEDAASGISDHERQLTQNGAARLRAAARVIAALNIKPAYLFSSPRVRARQTAEIVAEALGMGVEIREEVNFGFDLDALDRLLDGVSDTEELMFVGHEPTFSAVIRALTGGSVEMKKGGLARVDVTQRDPLRGTLVWLIVPRVFDALAGE